MQWSNLPDWAKTLAIVVLVALGVISFSDSPFTPSPSAQQVEVNIIVQDEDRQGIDGARVQFIFNGAPVSELTDIDGYARIKILERDDIDITITKDCFKTYSKTINLKPGQDRTLTYQLQKDETCTDSTETKTLSQPSSTDAVGFNPNDPHVILLDNSGSMGDCPISFTESSCRREPDVPRRIDDAKQVIRNILSEDWFDNTPLALVEFGDYQAYGMIEEQACTAYKQRVPMGKNNHQDLLTGLEKIRPNDNGATPTGHVLQEMYSLYFKNSKPGTIILLTDGGANCTHGAVSTTFEDALNFLIAQKVKFVIELVGYKLDSEADERYRELEKEFAEIYPGLLKYFGTSSNLKELQQKVEEVVAYSPQKPSSPPEIKTPRIELRQRETETGTNNTIIITSPDN
jgi:hypothetical protein